MTRVILFALLLFFSVSVSVFCKDFEKYYSIQEYISIHPEQEQLLKSFAKTVSAEAKPLSIMAPEIIKIGVLYPALQKSDYWRDNVKAMERRLEELGIRYQLFTYFSKPSGDFRLQAFQLSEALHEKVDYMVMSIDNDNIIKLVSNILLDGHPKVIIQNLTTPLKKWSENPPYMYSGFDHVTGSRILAEVYSRRFPKGAKYLLLYGSRGTVSEQRGTGFERQVMTKGMIPVAKFYTDYEAQKAYEAVKTILNRGVDFDFVFACATDVAIGAAQAIKEAGLSDKIPVNGWGGTNNELELIKKGELSFTVMRMNDDSGVAVAEAIKNDLIGTPDITPEIFNGQFVTVTKEMTANEIEKLKERALRYSGK